jgi:hypothetical protein
VNIDECALPAWRWAAIGRLLLSTGILGQLLLGHLALCLGAVHVLQARFDDLDPWRLILATLLVQAPITLLCGWVGARLLWVVEQY